MLTVLPWSIFQKLLLLISSSDTLLQTWHRTILRAKIVGLKTFVLEATKFLLYPKSNFFNLFLTNNHLSIHLLDLFAVSQDLSGPGWRGPKLNALFWVQPHPR